MAVTNGFKQFDSSKTNLGTAPDNGFTPNSVAKAEEVNRSIYDVSLPVTALLESLCNYTISDKQTFELSPSDTLTDLESKVDSIRGFVLDKTPYFNKEDESTGETTEYVYPSADNLKYNNTPVYFKSIGFARDGTGYPFDNNTFVGYDSYGYFRLGKHKVDHILTTDNLSSYLRITNLGVLNGEASSTRVKWFNNNIVLNAWFVSPLSLNLTLADGTSTSVSHNIINLKYGGLLSMPTQETSSSTYQKILFNATPDNNIGTSSFVSSITLSDNKKYSIGGNEDLVYVVYVRRSVLGEGI